MSETIRTEDRPLIFPATGIIPTRNRTTALKATLESLALQSTQPAEIIIIDASDTNSTQELLKQKWDGIGSTLIYLKAMTRGAASQRNEGIAAARYSYIFLMDDDLLFEKDCLKNLFVAIDSDVQLGGVNAMITNQQYSPPGRISSLLFQFLNGSKLDSYAGKCLGPVVNLLPEDRPGMPEVVQVEWLNSGCTVYRKEALPNPVFPKFFTGYSMFEDVTVSSNVGKKWKLANVRIARVFHDSQPGDYKSSLFVLNKMEIVNRYYVMTRVLQRNRLSDFMKLTVVELFKVSSYFQNWVGIKKIHQVVGGKMAGIIEIIRHARDF